MHHKHKMNVTEMFFLSPIKINIQIKNKRSKVKVDRWIKKIMQIWISTGVQSLHLCDMNKVEY